MNRFEFIKELYEEGLKDKDGRDIMLEDERMCANRIVCLLESIAFSLDTIAFSLESIGEKLNG